MASLIRTKPLSVCIMRCAEVIHHLDEIPQFQDLQQQAKALLSSLMSMLRAVRPTQLDQRQPDPAYSPGLSLLAAYLNELDKTCGYYGTRAQTEWRLSDDERAFVLGQIGNPFERLVGVLSHLAQSLQAIIEDGQESYHTRIQKLCEWAESMFEGWNFFQGEFEAAKTLAAAFSPASEGQSTTETFVTADEWEDSCSDKVIQNLEPQKVSAWDEIGEQLAQEGIMDDAIKKVAEDLKACARSLVRGDRPRTEPVERQSPERTSKAAPAVTPKTPDPSSKKTKTSASGKPTLCEASATPSAKKAATAVGVKPEAPSSVSEDWFNQDFVSSKVTTVLDKIKKDFDLYLPELLVVAFKQKTEKDTKNFRQVLDLVKTMACHDTDRARLCARLAKEIQARTPGSIRRNVAYKHKGTKYDGEGPVTGYLLDMCARDWDHGKNGRPNISVEHFALGLSRFIGELVKFGVFKTEHVHTYVRAQWGPTLNRNQFMAVYKLLRTTGPMVDSHSDTSDMDDHFTRIAGLVNKKKTPEPVKSLGQELLGLRSSGWKSKQTKEMDRVEEAIRKRN
ncbi:hypothetical protein KVR01_000388 [Diaporthe batatas]|uniref:uncharacterized protein n=1 Tax=Diaporthe batatas TaxID=748121 RepID=UPI001D040A7D|nr:uncharacterized protein KVR01_000388 [Diaporthe batatas]KAG8169643.1 hypothetical protein KVR01_000388 [Diaporthe batatas]